MPEAAERPYDGAVTDPKTSVRRYWDERPCGDQHTPDTARSVRQVERVLRPGCGARVIVRASG